MEFLNKTEIIGCVGSVQVQEVNGLKVARITAFTETCYHGQADNLYVDRDWHYITAWAGEGIANPLSIGKGDWIHVVGRTRSTAHINPEGYEVRLTEILAHKLEILEDHE